MASKKITVTLEESRLDRIRRLVSEGGATSVSGFVQKAVEMALEDLSGWDRSLEEFLEATGGPLSADEQAWVDHVLGKPAA